MSEVKISLSQLLQILTPPVHIKTVDNYRKFIRETLDAPASTRPVGRPSQNRHPAYTETQWRLIRAYVAMELRDNPTIWEYHGHRATGMSSHQPQNEGEIELDNGQVMLAAFQFNDTVAYTDFPPGPLH